MRLTERYMDPPGQAMPDCLIAARLANNLERVSAKWKGRGRRPVQGFDWKTEEDAFIDGYNRNAKGGEFVTYDRLSAMGTNGVQEPATDFEDGKLVGTKRLYTDGKFSTKTARLASWRRRGAAGRPPARRRNKEVRLSYQQWPRQRHLAKRLSRPARRPRHGSLALSLSSR